MQLKITSNTKQQFSISKKNKHNQSASFIFPMFLGNQTKYIKKKEKTKKNTRSTVSFLISSRLMPLPPIFGASRASVHRTKKMKALYAINRIYVNEENEISVTGSS